MKRPEYVAIVAGVYAAAIRERREPTAEELDQLQRAFSRSGFTQGYYLDEKGPDMFGTRTETEAPETLYAAARESYRKENPLVGVELSVRIKAGQQIAATASDGQGHTVHAAAPAPEPARTRATTREEVQEQLSKTGGTPYFIRELNVEMDDGLALPKSCLNQLRRETLEKLTALRAAPPKRRVLEGENASKVPGPTQPPQLCFSLHKASQLTPGLWSLPHRFIDLPAGEFCAHAELLKQAIDQGARLRVALPRISWDREEAELEEQLKAAWALGVRDALIPTWDRVAPAKKLGFALYGDFGLGVYNSRTLDALKELGFGGGTCSFEMKWPMLRSLSKPVELEAIVYGRLPLMMLEQAPGGRAQDGLTDRLGLTFPLQEAPGGRYELLNSQVLYLADKVEWKRSGLTGARLLFTDETPEVCARVAGEYLEGGTPPKQFTRGLYYRDVE